MTAGAITANSQDGGSVWYNPAGLGAIHRSQVDLSGSTYGLRIRPVSALLTSNFPGNAATLDANAANGADSANGGSATGSVLAQVRDNFRGFGGQAAVGLQWTFAHHWDLGVTVRSPELLFGSIASRSVRERSPTLLRGGWATRLATRA